MENLFIKWEIITKTKNPIVSNNNSIELENPFFNTNNLGKKYDFFYIDIKTNSITINNNSSPILVSRERLLREGRLRIMYSENLNELKILKISISDGISKIDKILDGNLVSATIYGGYISS